MVHKLLLILTLIFATGLSSANSLKTEKLGSKIRSISVTSDGCLLASIDFKGVYRSVDGGNTWIIVFPLEEDFYGWQLLTLKNGNTLLSTYRGLFISRDQGSTWQSIMSGITEGFWTTFWFLKSDSQGRLYFNASFDNLKTSEPTLHKTYRSIDNGETWQELKGENIKNVMMYSLAIDSEDKIIGNGWWQIDGKWDSALIHSENLGQTWEAISSNIPVKGHVQQLIYSSRDSLLAHIVTGTKEDGIYATSTMPNRWVKLSNGLPENMNSRNLVKAPSGDLYTGGYTKVDGKYLGLGLLHSKDNGNSWISLGQTLPDDLWLTSIHFDDKHGLLIGSMQRSLGNHTLYQSLDNGLNWKMILDVADL